MHIARASAFGLRVIQKGPGADTRGYGNPDCVDSLPQLKIRVISQLIELVFTIHRLYLIKKNVS